MFDEEGWSYEMEECTEGKGVEFRTSYQGKNIYLRCWGMVNSEALVFNSIYPNFVPADKKVAMAEVLNRLNDLLWFGTVQMKWTDGVIRFRTSIPIVDDQLSASLVKEVVFMNLRPADEIYPTLMKLIYGDTTPEAVMAEFEKQNDGNKEETSVLVS
jgi:hypothetical protein